MGDNIISSEDKTQLYDLLLKCQLSDDVLNDLQDAANHRSDDGSAENLSKKSRYKQRYMSKMTSAAAAMAEQNSNNKEGGSESSFNHNGNNNNHYNPHKNNNSSSSQVVYDPVMEENVIDSLFI